MRAREPVNANVGRGTISVKNRIENKKPGNNGRVHKNGSSNGHHTNGQNGNGASRISPESLRGQVAVRNGNGTSESHLESIKAQDEIRIKILKIIRDYDGYGQRPPLVKPISNSRYVIIGMRKDVANNPITVKALKKSISDALKINQEKIFIGHDPTIDENPKPKPPSKVVFTNHILICGHKIQVKGIGDKKSGVAQNALKIIFNAFPNLKGNIIVGTTTLTSGERILKVFVLNEEDKEKIETLRDRIPNTDENPKYGVDAIEFVKEKEEPEEITNHLLLKYYLELKEELHKHKWPNSRVCIVNRELGGEGNSNIPTIVFLIDGNDYELKTGKVGLTMLESELEPKIKAEMCIPTRFKVLPELEKTFEKIFKDARLRSTQVKIKEDKSLQDEIPFFEISTAFIELTVFESELKAVVEKEYTEVLERTIPKKQKHIDKDEIRENILRRLEAEIAEAASFTEEVVKTTVSDSKPPEKKPALKVLITPAKTAILSSNGASKSERNGKPRTFHHTNGHAKSVSANDLRIAFAKKTRSMIEDEGEIKKLWNRDDCPKEGKNSISNINMLPILLNRITRAFEDGRISFTISNKHLSVEIDRLDNNDLRNKFFKDIALEIIQSTIPHDYTASTASGIKKTFLSQSQDNGKSRLDNDPDDLDFNDLLEDDGDFRSGEQSIVEAMEELHS